MTWDTGSESMKDYDGFAVVNKNEPRVDAMKLALGKGTYTDDLKLPDTLLQRRNFLPR